ncbi:transcription antitermination factor NusB [Lysinibacillus piscis]|uniref:Transcription antitermination protein NusB n=1 Tax=Lysinibacillus piscis TaxID=2518931 RepID=A0ABQ5NK69_9BACI|nr:transcription antitermination factor NusB [Lysinibacillus sp. KH24]GLC88764.1 N utilization substance protein B [Lysinibacillus sp. KH24]
MKRHEAREKALQVLFQLDNTDLTVEEAMSHIKGQPTNTFYEKIVTGTAEHLEEIDAAITQHLEKWSLARLPKIERTVLRLAVYEILYMPETPKRVVLNEAIELCKTFGDDSSSKFVNGVLSKFTEQ